MKAFIKLLSLLFLATLLVSSCSSAPEPKKKTENSAQSQKKNAEKAQRELSSGTRNRY